MFINDESTGSTGADIDPEELDTPSISAAPEGASSFENSWHR
jgi:hypothetical protein